MTGSLPAKAPRVGELLSVLLAHEVEFVVIGGMAGLAHGSSYPSFDLDVAYERGERNIRRLVAALTEIGVLLRGAPDDLPFQLDERAMANGANFTFRTRFGDFDVLADIRGMRAYDELARDAQRKVVAGHEVKVASIDHLIAMKRAANRVKDQRMLEDYLVIADEQQRAAAQKP